MMRLLIAIGLFLPRIVAAAPPQPSVDPCQGIGGCSTNGKAMISLAVQNTASLFVAVAAGASILFVVLGGFQMLTSFGNESAVSKGRNSAIFALGGFALALGAQAIISFVVSNAFAGGLTVATANPAIALMATSVNIMMGVFNAVFAVVAVGAGLRMVLAHGKTDEFGKARSALMFAVIGAALINVARAIVNIILTAGF